MKLHQKRYFWVISTIILLIGYVVSCTKDNQPLDIPQPINNTTDLVSVRISTPPSIDGTIEAMWENCPKLKFDVIVPDPGGDIFRSYVGNTIPNVALRSAYDADNIYFLAEWSDPTRSYIREPWYFDPVTKRWNHEDGAPTFNSNGTIARKAFYEDKIAMLFNIDNSVTGWNNGTCYKSCHTGLSEEDGFARHHTNSPTERIDMWHWKLVRNGEPFGQFDDQYQDNTYPNGRMTDDKTSGGYSNNTQSKVITGSSPAITVNVPKYVIPDRSNYNWILGSEITDGTAKLVTAVDANGVLSYAGGTIDPNSDEAYQRNGPGVGAKAIPFIYTSPWVGSRGDITCRSTYTGSGWVLEFKRALKTADTKKQDVDFSSLVNQYFGFAIFENAQIAHAIKPNLVLKFNK